MFRALICPSSGARHYTSVITAYGVWCLGCWWSAVRSRAAGYASGMREIVRRIACCSAPNSRPPATKASHTICGNNRSIVSSSWWWAYKCPKHVEQITSAIKHSVASCCFSSLPLYYDARTNIHQIRKNYLTLQVFVFINLSMTLRFKFQAPSRKEALLI